MLEPQEFEDEFYLSQNEKMTSRYSKIFKKWGLSWNKYYEYVAGKLRNNHYWLWVFLCGFEKFLQEDFTKQGRKVRLYKDADSRIFRIVGDFFQVETYIKNL